MVDRKTRQPPWTRDETILALELYVRVPKARSNLRHPETTRLSRELNNFSIHPVALRGAHFRNPSGIGMQLMNSTPLDPAYTKRGRTGMTHGSQLQAEIWQEFFGRPDTLSRVATAIRAFEPTVSRNDGVLEDSDEAIEGRVLTKVHRLRERNAQLVAAKKADVLHRLGRLACEVCAFDFEQQYGALGAGFAECHHTVPLSGLEGSRTTRLNDLSVVCANCHRMLHRQRPWPTISQLRDIRRSFQRSGS